MAGGAIGPAGAAPMIFTLVVKHGLQFTTMSVI